MTPAPLTDEQVEQAIATASLRLQSRDRAVRREAMAELKRLHPLRSKRRVEQLERELGLRA